MTARDRYDSLFKYYGDLFGADWIYLKAQARAESDLNPNAKSPVGALGLAQFMPKTWAEWKDGTPGIQEIAKDVLDDPRNPENAIMAQAAYFANLAKHYKNNYRLVFAAYNWGMGHLDKLIAQEGTDVFENLVARLPQETKDYVKRIFSFIAD